MADTLQSVFIGGAAGLISALITHFSTRAKVHLDLAAEYDKKLQESRVEAYKELWTILEPLARFGREKPITYTTLRDVSGKTRAWYFQTGGIYLTQASRKPYFAWKELMQPVLDDRKLAEFADMPLPVANVEASGNRVLRWLQRRKKQTQLDKIIAACSALRTSLSDDIGTKRLSRL